MTKKFDHERPRFIVRKDDAVTLYRPPVPPYIIDESDGKTFSLGVDDLPEMRLKMKLTENEKTRLALIIMGWRVIDTLAGDLAHRDPRWQVIDPDGFAVDYQPTEDEAWASAERLQLERREQKLMDDWRKGLEGDDDGGEAS